MTKSFAASQIRLNAVDLIQAGGDPSSGGGVAGAIGSFYLRSGTGQAWLKTGASNTAWQKLVQSFAWYSVRDYGATGDGTTDDTTAFQSAINECGAAGGGVVFVPSGTYAITQLSIAVDNVQLLGTGTSSIIKWKWNAATVAGSMLTVAAGADHIRMSLLKFDGSALTNPNAGRANHLLAIGAGGAVTEVQVFQCAFGGMVANSGDGIHLTGSAGNLVSRCWIVDNMFDGCSRYGIGVEQGWEYGWIVDNYMTNCETEIAFVSTADVGVLAMLVQGNEIVHTGTVRHAMRFEGPATTLIKKLIVAENIVLGGLTTMTLVDQAVIDGNVQTSGAFASADPIWRVYDNAQHIVFTANLLNRDSGASAGPCVTFEKSTASPTYFRVGQNVLINEKVGGGFMKVVDCAGWSAGGNLCRSSDAGASIMYGVDVQAVTTDVTDAMIGPGNMMTAGANSMAAAVRLLANGANIVDASIVGNQANNIDYGTRCEVGGGGGAFTGQLLIGGNNFNGSVGDINQVGVTVRPRIGFNAGALGANLFQGTGSPEGVVTARIGSMYLRTDGGQASAVYYKESGSSNTGWLALGGSVLVFGGSTTTTVATAVYLGPGWITTPTATELQIAITRPGTIRNLRVQVAGAGTDSSNVTYTVRKNGVDTALAATINNNASGAASDTADSFTVVAGDLISISVTKAGVVTAGQSNVTAAVELV
jgi:hypothetical protein